MSRSRIAAAILIGVAVVAGLVLPESGRAQSVETRRERMNQNTVGIISGGVNGTYVRIAGDLAAVLDDGETLRILPVLGKGSLQNITDLLYLKGIDVAIVQSDVLSFVRQQNLEAGIDRRIRYITKLYDEEVHILARADVRDVAALAGRKVNVDVKGSGTAMTAATLFGLLEIAVQPTHFDQALALEKLRAGEIQAMVYVAGKPTELFKTVDGASGLRFLALPAQPKLLETYLPSTLDARDYPRLIPDGGPPVETLAVGAVMAVYNWEANPDRQRRVARFVEAFFGRFDQFLKPPRHPKWQDVNLAATLPGWSRFQPAEDWLARRTSGQAASGGDAALRTSFDQFLQFMADSGLRPANEPLAGKEREALFARFLEWHKAQTPP